MPADPVAAVRAGVALGVPAEPDLDGHVRVGELPGVAASEPVVGLLDLPAVAEGLAEDAELVADAVPHARDAQRRQRVEIAGGESAQPAVPQSRLGLDGPKLVQTQPEVGERLAGNVLAAAVEQVIVKLAAGQELGREVANVAGLLIE